MRIHHARPNSMNPTERARVGISTGVATFFTFSVLAVAADSTPSAAEK